MKIETQEQFNIKIEQAILNDLGPDATTEEKLLWAQRLLALTELISESVA
jgi:hypothetical protein